MDGKKKILGRILKFAWNMFVAGKVIHVPGIPHPVQLPSLETQHTTDVVPRTLQQLYYMNPTAPSNKL